MKHNLIHLIFCLLSLFSVIPLSAAQRAPAYYVFDGRNLHVMDDRPVQASYVRWQIWLYPEHVPIARQTTGSPYSRWGLLEGRSAENVMQQLETFQGFERAYLHFFGPGEWGRHTFFNPVGPVAVTSEAAKNEPAEALYLNQLNGRINALITTLQPSLENNKNDGPSSAVKDYFEQVENCLAQVAKLYSELNHPHPQLSFIDDGIARTRSTVEGVDNGVRQITAALPTVKLPTNNAWKFHKEWAGSDGIIEVAVSEVGSGVRVQQTWTGGDGGMRGLVVLTTVPYEDIGDVELDGPGRSGGRAWTVRVGSAGSQFRETGTSPERQTAKGLLRAVNYETTVNFVYLDFSNPAEAQDAYVYFLYHQELGR
jgi:hypothetical protein